MRLLTHLALSLPQTENLASEALAFILSRSATARRAFAGFVSHPDLTIPQDIMFRPQARDEADTIPDIAGTDEEGTERVLIEAKFWAGLTDNQPVEYIKRLNPDNALLLFLVPEARLPTLWPEVMRRCSIGGLEPESVDIVGRHWTCARVGTKHMGITSWRRLLGFLSAEILKADERDLAQDIEQLDDLCRRMETEAFLPLSGSELAPQIGKRFAQFCQLVDQAVDVLVQNSVADKKGLRTKNSYGVYGRYFRLKGCGCSLEVNPHNWSRYAETPLWLDVSDEKWERTRTMRQALESLFNSYPPQAYEIDGHFCIPIFLRLKSEQDDVLKEIDQQVRTVERLLPDRKGAEQSPPPYSSPAAGSESGEA